MAVGAIAAMLVGLTMPAFMLYFGKSLDGLNDPSNIEGVIATFCIVFVVGGIVSFVCSFIYVYTWSVAGEQQALRLKEAYVRSILRQDVGWFDAHPAGQLPTLVTSLMASVQDGIGRKVADIIFNVTSCVGLLAVSFYLDPQLSAILLACLPLVGISAAVVTKLMTKAVLSGQGLYGAAGAVATEVFAAIRTVASLCSEPLEMARYGKLLIAVEVEEIKKGLLTGVGVGTHLLLLYLSFGLAFWYGITQVADDVGCTSGCKTGGKVVSAVFAVVTASVQLGQLSPGLMALSQARTSAATIFKTIDRRPAIDSFSEEGARLEATRGALSVEAVTFHYPARPDAPVYEGVSVGVAEGETLALVGPSGGGKSTMTKLLLRFYDPTSGAIKLDGMDIRSLNLNWYRQQIGYVGQEPVLFAGSIRDNIANGKPGATDDEIINAAKAANAHEFIKGFPKGFNTEVGEGGLQLSGGQKQRVAIARAIIKDPAILLLDEATSALDSESEKVVQQALDRLHELKRRTTITIAHRLSTIQNSDCIAVIANRGVAEIGTYTELMALDGIYPQLCTHTELMALDGIYAQLCAAQSGGADAAQRALRRQSSAEATRQRSLRENSSSAMAAIGSGQAEEGAGEGGAKGKTGQKDDNASKPKAPLRRLWALQRPDWPWVAVGIGGATLCGAINPVEGIILAKLQEAFYLPTSAAMLNQGTSWVLGFVGLAGTTLLGNLMLATGFATSGERMTRRLRAMAFKAIIRHDVGWFDAEEHSTAVLTTNLESDASAMAKATGLDLGHKVQLVMTLLLGVLIGLVAAWQVGLVAMATMPLIGLSSIVQMAMFTGSYGDTEGLDGGVSAGVILGSALNGIATVQAFNMQRAMSDRYYAAIQGTVRARQQRGAINGLAFGYSQGMTFWVFALLFWYGSLLVSRGTVTFVNFYMAMFAVILGAMGIGQVNADMGAQKAGQQAAARVFALCDAELKIDPLGEGGAKPERLSGAISFKNIKFAYPTRLEQPIYGGPLAPEGFSLEVAAGETVALVGPSGSGKSTCVSLLMRFYDVGDGRIEVDGRDVQELNIHWLRSNMGYVGQEPVLFTGTIRDNITKGNPDATMEEVENAARAANAHDFIMSFTDGYETDVGEKSALLSGGQKQRIAIARAILRNPNILLLDEATSALDNESERQVQAALDRLQSLQRRTTLVVAHRLTTIRNSDKIAVLGGGCVRELGTHDELMALPGSAYGKLYRQQTEMFT
ncbi:ATP-binding cassette, sub-family B, member 1A [Tribonema minus]|uniref:ATP-binding cassette, sub-family B, member 1A n=1 Tax=Tribonema minus TaxID=303371 RepID=A0A835Z7P7_9STRA|nr:ATP-binding cassette, sub-family B, member 1A [Tribonema minus]